MKIGSLKQTLSKFAKIKFNTTPQMNLVLGFSLYTLIGFALLCLPIFHKTEIPLLDNLFISTSAISTTGLVTISVSDSYNLAGQIVIVLLFQIGGIGYMTLTTYYLIFTKEKIGRWRQKIIDAEFAMPQSMGMRDFVRSAIIFTLSMEILGTICFFIAFKNDGMDNVRGIWYSIFHSISAFCTAGFGLFNDSFQGYQDNVFINSIVSILSISGSLGFIVITDIGYRITGKSEKLSFTTKIVLYGFTILLAVGTALIYFTEPLVHEVGNSPLMASFFQAMTSMTTVGFSTIPNGQLAIPILLTIFFLMFVGASPSGTAGGMKITTLTAIIAILKSRVVGQKEVSFAGKKIPFERLFVATSTFILYTTLIFIFTLLLAYSESFAFEEILFEVASALGTVGLTTGITADLSVVGKIMVIILMFVGRIGVLTFGFALFLQKGNRENAKVSEDDLAV